MILNYRQLAQGYKTKDNKEIKENHLIRTAFITPTDEHYDFINNLGIDSIFDFRYTHEVNSQPNFKLDLVKNYPLGSKINEKNLSNNKIKFQSSDMIDFYGKGFIGCEYLFQAVNDLVDNPKKIIFHCTAGKDRTGVFGIILMNILGFSEEDILNHYLTIDPNFLIAMKEKIKLQMPDMEDKDVDDLITVKKEYYDSYMNSIITNYTTFDNYLKEEFKLTDEKKQILKDYYLV